MKYKDYYKILGVDKNASDKDIQKAYKKLAKKYHPDINKDKGSEAKFKELNEANEVLGDKDKRKKYDTLGADWDKYQDYDFAGAGANRYQDVGNMGGNTFYGNDFSDFFEAFFGGQSTGFEGMFGGGGGRRTSTRGGQQQGRRQAYQEPPEPLNAELEISLDEAYKGGKRVITLQDHQLKKLEVNIPKGIEDGNKIRISGANNGGDVLLKIKIKPHHFFKLDKKDVHVEIPVLDYEAVIGAEVKIPTLSGSSINLKIPAHSHSGKTFRLKNLGMPERKQENKGDMYVKLKIEIPKYLTEKEMELYTQLKEARADKDHIRDDLGK
jgi:curved DNA-binding protein